ncbi:MAG: hypothetical protein IPJ74_23865 [Saprospiraceae bacterium]|nr:hypothetical protein [Saprospiraceae bacterium]
MIFEESRLCFDFDDENWSHLLKYDESKDYENLSEAIDDTKAVDFTGVLKNEILSLIEVKNFRGYRIENIPRISELDLEIAQKVRDTLAGVIGGVRNSTHAKQTWQKYLQFLQDENKPIHVVLWLEEDAPPRLSPEKSNRKIAAKGGSINARLKKRLGWLNAKVIVANQINNPYSESLKVTFL